MTTDEFYSDETDFAIIDLPNNVDSIERQFKLIDKIL